MARIKERKLEDRSKLVFEFPKQGNGKYVVTLPFYENIKISERKKANYKKYNLLSRSSQLYTYLGADSRKFNLEFHMSFPHILEEYGSQVKQNFLRYTDSEIDGLLRKAFTDAQFADEIIRGSRGEMSLVAKASEARRKFEESLRENEFDNTLLEGALDFLGGPADLLARGGEALGDGLRSLFGFDGSQKQPSIAKDNLIDVLLYWTAIIRSSVTNNSDNPVYGPPIVRINHGLLFRNIPCICTDYSLEPVEEAGYDLGTMMPRRIKYSMTLEEIRAGDFGTFNGYSSDPIVRDNLVGWEGVVEGRYNSMEPGGGI